MATEILLHGKEDPTYRYQQDAPTFEKEKKKPKLNKPIVTTEIPNYYVVKPLEKPFKVSPWIDIEGLAEKALNDMH